MNKNGAMFGVSPAYFLSRFTDQFTPAAMAGSLLDLVAAGFDAFQAEIFHAEAVDEWRVSGATLVDRAARECGIACSQFVGHFLLHAFESPEAIASPWGVEETEKTLEVMSRIHGCAILTVPIPRLPLVDTRHLTPDGHAALCARMIDKLRRMLEITERAGCRMSLEMMPGSPWPGIHGFLRLAAEAGSATLGYNFDTGHAWSSKEWVPGIPALAGARVLGTHLKDNCQDENLALAPGAGSIPWPATLTALAACGYHGSWDIEFRCPAGDAAGAYARALQFIRPLVESALAATATA